LNLKQSDKPKAHSYKSPLKTSKTKNSTYNTATDAVIFNSLKLNSFKNQSEVVLEVQAPSTRSTEQSNRASMSMSMMANPCKANMTDLITIVHSASTGKKMDFYPEDYECKKFFFGLSARFETLLNQ
jgi:hypothetical protein